MTDPAIIAASYAAEKNYSHNLDDVIDASDAVGAWGTAKESTTKLVDLSGNGNIADIHGAMPTEGFIQGRRFDGVDDYLNCDVHAIGDNGLTIIAIGTPKLDGISQKMIGRYWRSTAVGLDSANNIACTWSDTSITYPTSNLSSQMYVMMLLYDPALSSNQLKIILDGVVVIEQTETITEARATANWLIGTHGSAGDYWINLINYAGIFPAMNAAKYEGIFNTLARLPFWSVNYTDYPDNVTEYTDNLPYSSSIISSGTFKVDDDKLQCVSAGTMTYSASYKFDGSEYIKIEIEGVEYAGTGTITQGNTTVSVAQGSNKVTIEMGTGDTIDGIDIQFREEV